VKDQGLTLTGHLKLWGLSIRGESGIPSGAVKCTEIRRNTGGEGDFLADN
jgi:hypothetical protein